MEVYNLSTAKCKVLNTAGIRLFSRGFLLKKQMIRFFHHSNPYLDIGFYQLISFVFHNLIRVV